MPAKKYNESEIRSHYQTLTKFLIERNLTITTMESATAGQLASLITDTEGSSAVLRGAFVTYSNFAKIQQGVPAKILDRYTVYSRETAIAMAEACRKAYDADIGIGVTGTMGNVDPANSEASVPGQVYFAIAMRKPGRKSDAAGSQTAGNCSAGGQTSGNSETSIDTTSYYVELAPQPTRLMYKLAVAEEIYEALMGLLSEG